MALSQWLPFCILPFVIIVMMWMSLILGPVYGREVSYNNDAPEFEDEGAEVLDLKRDDDPETLTPIDQLPDIIKEHLKKKLNITEATPMKGRSMMTIMGSAVASGMKIAYKVADKATLGVSSKVVNAAKDKAIDVALNAYMSGMLDSPSPDPTPSKSKSSA